MYLNKKFESFNQIGQDFDPEIIAGNYDTFLPHIFLSIKNIIGAILGAKFYSLKSRPILLELSHIFTRYLNRLNQKMSKFIEN